MNAPVPYWQDEGVELYLGDCIEVLVEMGTASVDAVCTDPPYGLEFMGKEWDGANGFRRSLNPADAGRDNVFGRTSRTSSEYEDRYAGVVSDRDFKGFVLSQQRTRNVKCPECQRWIYDHPGRACECGGVRRAQVSVYQEWCEAWARECLRVLKPGGHLLAFGGTRTYHRLTCAIEDAGFEIRDSLHWIYGSGFPKSPDVLKPAHEPIVLARKPLAGTVAQNVLKHGTGALNVDECRVEGGSRPARSNEVSATGLTGTGGAATYGSFAVRGSIAVGITDAGRWPPNVLLDPEAAAELDRQSGIRHSGDAPRVRHSSVFGDCYGEFAGQRECPPGREANEGGASRFFPVFRYEAKAGSDERPRLKDGTAHPTVKPLDLMRWLVRLVIPPDGLVLDPFAGTGTTAEACLIEGFRCVLIEREAAYAELIRKRLDKPIQPVLFSGESTG